jgi:hypothetical protein
MRTMKYLLMLPHARLAQAATVFIAPMALLAAAAVQAQTVYRCPTANGITPYTNDKAEATRLNCTPLTGGNVTIIEGTKVASANNESGAPSAPKVASPAKVATASQAGSRIDTAEQRSRDSDMKQILESELKKAEAKQSELLKEFNNGEPEKRGDESRNNQKYIDRVAEMKANIARNDSDIASIKRELGRTSSATSAANKLN